MLSCLKRNKKPVGTSKNQRGALAAAGLSQGAAVRLQCRREHAPQTQTIFLVPSKFIRPGGGAGKRTSSGIRLIFGAPVIISHFCVSVQTYLNSPDLLPFFFASLRPEGLPSPSFKDCPRAAPGSLCSVRPAAQGRKVAPLLDCKITSYCKDHFGWIFI